MILAPAEGRTSVPPHANPNLDRIAINAGLYLYAVQVRYIPNTDSYSDIQRWYLPPSVACSFQICKIFVHLWCDQLGLSGHSFTFVDVHVKQRVLDRRSSDLIKRVANRL